MRVSAKAEYACIAVLELAANYADPQPVRVKAIADAHGLKARFLVQILLQLKRSGLVASTRGAAGGYQLARRPEDVSLADVFDAVDFEPAPRPAPSTAAKSPAAQAIHAVWRELQAEERRLLEELKYSELVRRTQERGAISYQI